MSYDIYLRKSDGDVFHFDGKHQMAGGTYALGGTTRAWLNVTYNYSRWYRRDDVFPNGAGIYCLQDKAVKESIPILQNAIHTLETLNEELTEEEIRHYRFQGADGYWMPTRENAINSLRQLLTMAEMCTNQYVWWDIC